MTENNSCVELLKPIPGYEGVYFIHPSGAIVNKNNRILKPFKTKRGEAVELRNRGQREQVLISDLLKRMEDPHGSI